MTKSFTEKHSRLFFLSSAILLMSTALAKLYSATDSARILLAIDPLLGINNGKLMIVTGLCELLIALYLVFAKNSLIGSLLLLWLSSNFIFYRIASQLLDIKMCPCLGTLTQKLPLDAELVDAAMMLVVLYMFFGSGAFLIKVLNRGSDDTLAGRTPATTLAS